ncbi:MAG: LCP family protein [Anaerolineae bacterium]|nr:LCP family protein [Anaerolineae bacterium]
MRISQRFVFAWVIVVAITAVAASIFSYTFVRDRAAEADQVLELPDPPQLGDLNPFSGDTADETAPSSTAPPDVMTPGVAAESPVEMPSVEAAEVPAESPGENAGSETDTAASPSEEPDPVEAASAGAVAGSALLDDPRRVTVLLMGIDQRAGEEGTFPTDTMIVFSLDPVGQTGAILSIPRDLWVEYPGLGQPGRINSANILGDDINYPGGGGPAFAVKTAERTLGIPIDYYVLLNFEVFIKVVDAVGPIEVCPPETIHDEHYPDGSYGYITVHFDPGCQDLDAEHLLQYARTRHGDSDISRSTRQQEVILAVRQKVLSTGGVMALLPEAPSLWASVQENIRTNMTFEDLVSLALKTEDIPSDNIRQGQITYAEVYSSTTPEGDEILIPIGSDIRRLIEDLFRAAGTPSLRETQ